MDRLVTFIDVLTDRGWSFVNSDAVRYLTPASDGGTEIWFSQDWAIHTGSEIQSIAACFNGDFDDEEDDDGESYLASQSDAVSDETIRRENHARDQKRAYDAEWEPYRRLLSVRVFEQMKRSRWPSPTTIGMASDAELLGLRNIGVGAVKELRSVFGREA